MLHIFVLLLIGVTPLEAQEPDAPPASVPQITQNVLSLLPPADLPEQEPPPPPVDPTPRLMEEWQTLVNAAGDLPPRIGDYPNDPTLTPEQRLENLRGLARAFEANIHLAVLDDPYRLLVTRFSSAGEVAEAEKWLRALLRRNPPNSTAVAEALYRVVIAHHTARNQREALNWMLVAEDRVMDGEDVLVNFFRTEEMSALITNTYRELGQDTLAFDWNTRITKHKWDKRINAAVKVWEEKKDAPSAISVALVYRDKKERAPFNEWRQRATDALRADWPERLKTEPGLLAVEARMLMTLYEHDNPQMVQRWRGIIATLSREQVALEERQGYLAQADTLKTEWEDFRNPFAALHLALAYSRDNVEESRKWRALGHKHINENHQKMNAQEMVLAARRLAELYKPDNPQLSDQWARMIPVYEQRAIREAQR
jgi:hypothetical protein